MLRYWSMRSNTGSSAAIKYRALPTAHSDVVFNLSGAKFYPDKCALSPISSRAFFVGMADWQITCCISGCLDMFGIQFRHEVLRPLMRFDMDELTGRQIDLSQLLGRDVEFLAEQLSDEHDDVRRINLVEGILIPKCLALSKLDLVLPGAVQTLLTMPELHSIRSMSENIGLSARQLERVFKRNTGLSPKRFAEVGRFMKSTRMLDRGISFAETAFTLGYSDQAHFNRAFKKHSGLSPGEYLNTPDVVFIQDMEKP